MAEQKRVAPFAETQFLGLTLDEREALAAMDTLDTVQAIINGFTEGKQITLAGIQTCRFMIDAAMKKFFVLPKQQAASIGKRAALQRAHLAVLEGTLSSFASGSKN